MIAYGGLAWTRRSEYATTNPSINFCHFGPPVPKIVRYLAPPGWGGLRSSVMERIGTPRLPWSRGLVNSLVLHRAGD